MTEDLSNSGPAPVYGRALALRDSGISDEAIAATLGVAVEAVPALIEVAARKVGAADPSTAEPAPSS